MARISRGLLAAVFTVGVLAGSAATGVRAQGLLDVRMLSASLANQLVGDAVASCAQQGYAVTAIVVDLDGVRQAMLRGDRAPIHTVDFAFNKAYSAATLTLARKEDSTKAVAERMSKNPASTLPATPPPHITYAAGGVTIMAGGTAIGAIGVSGAPGGNFDDACARAALGKIQNQLK